MKKFIAIFMALAALMLIGCSEQNKPDSLEYIGLSNGTYAVAVGDASNYKDIVIPSQYNGRSVTKIADKGFDGCVNITSVTIPESVTEIGVNAFMGCVKLENIKFEGTIKQWESVKKGDFWSLGVATTRVVCFDGSVIIK